MIALAPGWGTQAALAAWTVLAFWLGRASAGGVRRRSDTIAEIRLMREATGLGLAAAKRAVEALEG